MGDPTQPLPGTTRDPRFPDTDENGRGASDFHTNAVVSLREDLRAAFVEEAGVYVTCWLPLCYEEGKPVCRIAPDVFVAKRAGKKLRYTWSIVDEKAVPDAVFEIVAAETLREDLYGKRRLYNRLGVREYFLFDPEADCLRPPLRGFRNMPGRSVPIKPNQDGTLTSRVLRMRLQVDGNILRLLDRRTRLPVPTWENRIQHSQRFADELVKEVGRLRAELRRRDAQ